MAKKGTEHQSDTKPVGFSRMHIGLICVGACVAAVLGFLGLLFLVGVTLFDRPTWVPGWGPRFKALDKSVGGHVVAAAVTLVGGIVALVTYILNRDQKEKHHAATLEQERLLASEKAEADRKFEAQRERRERDLAELQRIEAEFAALMKDFADDKPLSRINAAIGLAELATRPDPRRLDDDGYLLPDLEHYAKLMTLAGDGDTILAEPRPWPAVWQTTKTPTNYPYFLRAGSRLAAALHSWDDLSSREQAIRSLIDLGHFATHIGTDEPLLHKLVNATAWSNRIAWFNVVKSDELVNATYDWLQHLSDKHPRYPSNESTRLRSRDEGNPILYREKERRLFAKRRVLNLTNGMISSGAFEDEEVRNRIFKLDSTIYVVSALLAQFSSPPDNRDAKLTSHKLRERRNLDLHGLMLYGANLSAAHLQGANFRDATLIDVYGKGAHFDNSLCVNVRFDGAFLFEACFRGADCAIATFDSAMCSRIWGLDQNEPCDFTAANCCESQFIGADCQGARFALADASQATFIDANCAGADFSFADLRWADLDSASFRGANLSGAILGHASLNGTLVFGAKMGQHGGSTPTVFFEREFEDADFSRETEFDGVIFEGVIFEGDPEPYQEPEQTDAGLMDYLNARHPKWKV